MIGQFNISFCVSSAGYFRVLLLSFFLAFTSERVISQEGRCTDFGVVNPTARQMTIIVRPRDVASKFSDLLKTVSLARAFEIDAPASFHSVSESLDYIRSIQDFETIYTVKVLPGSYFEETSVALPEQTVVRGVGEVKPTIYFNINSADDLHAGLVISNVRAEVHNLNIEVVSNGAASFATSYCCGVKGVLADEGSSVLLSEVSTSASIVNPQQPSNYYFAEGIFVSGSQVCAINSRFEALVPPSDSAVLNELNGAAIGVSATQGASFVAFSVVGIGNAGDICLTEYCQSVGINSSDSEVTATDSEFKGVGYGYLAKGAEVYGGLFSLENTTLTGDFMSADILYSSSTKTDAQIDNSWLNGRTMRISGVENYPAVSARIENSVFNKNTDYGWYGSPSTFSDRSWAVIADFSLGDAELIIRNSSFPSTPLDEALNGEFELYGDYSFDCEGVVLSEGEDLCGLLETTNVNGSARTRRHLNSKATLPRLN